MIQRRRQQSLMKLDFLAFNSFRFRSFVSKYHHERDSVQSEGGVSHRIDGVERLRRSMCLSGALGVGVGRDLDGVRLIEIVFLFCFLSWYHDGFSKPFKGERYARSLLLVFRAPTDNDKKSQNAATTYALTQNVDRNERQKMSKSYIGVLYRRA